MEILQDEIEMAQDEIGFQFGPGGRNHFAPRTKSLRTQEEITSDLEDEIARTKLGGRNHFGPRTESLRAWRTGLGGWNWEDEITSGLGRNHFGPGGRNWEDGIGRTKSLRTWDEIT